jgi:hypothetical protein
MKPRADCLEGWPIHALTIFLAGLLMTTGARSYAQTTDQASTAGSSACVGDSGGITLSPGFCATVFGDKLGHARHLVVAPNGIVYVNTWSGIYYHNDTPPPGGFLIALQDTKGDGRADKTVRSPRRRATRGEPASRSTRTTSTRRRTIASCVTRCRRVGSSRLPRRRPWCRGCP